MTGFIVIAIIVIGVFLIGAMLFFAVRGLINPAADYSRKAPPVGDSGGVGFGGDESPSNKDSGNWFTNLFGGGDGGFGGFDGGSGGGDGGGGGGG